MTEINRTIHEKLFNAHWHTQQCEEVPENCYLIPDNPDYSGDIKAAFDVVGEMKSKGFAFHFHYSPDRIKGKGARAKFEKAFQQSGGGNSHEPSFSDNPAEAICKAALEVL